MPNKIASNLSPEQLEAFNERCFKTRGLTLQKIADLADEMGITISLESARTYKDTTFEQYLEDLKRKKHVVEMIDELGKDGKSAAGAALSIALQQMLERLIENKGLTNEDLTCFVGALNAAKKREDEIPKLTAQITKLNTQVSAINALLDAYKRKETDWNDARAKVKALLEGAKAKGGLTKEALKRMQEAAAIL